MGEAPSRWPLAGGCRGRLLGGARRNRRRSLLAARRGGHGLGRTRRRRPARGGTGLRVVILERHPARTGAVRRAGGNIAHQELRYGVQLPDAGSPALVAVLRVGAIVLRVVMLVVGQELTDDVDLAADRLLPLGEVPGGRVLGSKVRRHLDDHRLAALPGGKLLATQRFAGQAGIATDADVEVDILRSL